MPVGFGVHSRRSTRSVSFLVLSGVVMLAPPHHASGQDPVPRRPLGREVPVYQPAPGDPERRSAPTIANPTGPVTLQDAVALALLHNPALAAFAWEPRALEARILQAGRPPNPVLDVQIQDLGASTLPGSASDQPVQPQTTIQLSQVIELGGKRAARQRVAARDRDLAEWDYEMARITVFTEVSRAFTDVLAAQETVALSDETARLVAQVQENVAARVAAGVVSPIEETRAHVALAGVRAEAARARRTLDASRTRLALLWGSPIPEFRSAVGNLKAEPPPLPPAGTLTALLGQNPELARWAAEVSQREAVLTLERSRRVVDIVVSAGYRRYTTIDSNAVVVGASVPLPFFNRNTGGIAEARIRLAKVHEERRAAEARVAGVLADAYAALATAHDEITILRTAVLPGAQQTFDAVSEGYRLGRFGFLDVLDAQRTLIGAGSQYLRALSDYYKAVANVERLIGAPLPAAPGLPPNAKE